MRCRSRSHNRGGDYPRRASIGRQISGARARNVSNEERARGRALAVTANVTLIEPLTGQPSP
jgi:hypothetical protein